MMSEVDWAGEYKLDYMPGWQSKRAQWVFAMLVDFDGEEARGRIMKTGRRMVMFCYN